MLLILLAACWGEPLDCTVVPAEDQQSCEVDEDCVVAHTDCADLCACAPVNKASQDAVEAAEPADCSDCQEAPCTQDCKETNIAICQRNVCTMQPGAGDTFQ